MQDASIACVKMEKLEKHAFIKRFYLKDLTPLHIKEQTGFHTERFSPTFSMVKQWIFEFKKCGTSTSDDLRSGRPVEITLIGKIHKIVKEKISRM